MPNRPTHRMSSAGSRALAAVGGLALVASGLAPAATAATNDEDSLGTASELGVERPVTSDELAAENIDTMGGAWLVEFSGAPKARGGKKSSLQRDHSDFKREAESLGADVQVTETYSSVWNGVSVRGSQSDVEKAAKAVGAKAIFPVAVVEPPEPVDGSSPEMDFATGMTGADIAQSELGFTGEGVRVGIMDTGIDYDHPDFGGNGSPDSTEFPTDRVAYGYDFVGDDYNADTSAEAYDPVPQPDGDPDDCQGHGTHVAGITGADGEITGVAPGTTLGAYRVFGCEGSTTSDIMLAAMDAAYEDGMDVLNMSIGSAFQNWPEYPTAVGGDALVDSGVVVVASIGNSGASGTWSAGAPGVGEKVIGVGSVDNAFYEAQYFTAAPDEEQIEFVVASPAPAPPESGTATLQRLGDPGTEAAQACEPIEEDLTGKVAFIERGVCAFHLKGVNAQEAGAEGVVLYNNVAGTVNPSLAGEPPVEIPYVAISQDDGLLLDARFMEGELEITWTGETVTSESPTGGLMSAFSSYGMSADLALKPDISAPGGNISSTYPLESGEYASISGTSMSSPHVAGAVALYLEAHPDTAATDMRQLLQNHADPVDWSLVTGAGYYEPAFRQGAGLLDIDDAIQATTNVTPGKMSLGESTGSGHTQTLTLTNDGESDVTYSVGNTGGVAAGPSPNNPAFYGPLATVEAPDSVTVPAGGSAEVEVTINDSGENSLAQYGGWITFNSEDASTLRVPYAGFDGDYQELPVLDHTLFPTMAKLTECDRLIDVECVKDGSWDIAGDGATYTMEDGDVPTALVHFEHSARSAEFRVYEANDDGSKGDPVHKVFPVAMSSDYLGRSGSADGFMPFAWDGTRSHNKGKGNNKRKTVADGDYILELTVVKALGDKANPDHVETWTGTPFTIDRADGGEGDGDEKGPEVTVKDGENFTTGSDGRYSKVSFKLHDPSDVDRLTLNGTEKDLNNNKWSDLNHVTPGKFGAVEGQNTLVVHDALGNTTTVEFVLDATGPEVSVKSGSTFTVGADGVYDKVSYKLHDKSKVDGLTLNGTEKDLSNNKWSDLNYVTPGKFGAVEGQNTLVVHDTLGNTTTVEFTLN